MHCGRLPKSQAAAGPGLVGGENQHNRDDDDLRLAFESLYGYTNEVGVLLVIGVKIRERIDINGRYMYNRD